MPRYIMMGNHSSEWIARQPERSDRVYKQLEKLGLEVKSSNYTQGIYDFVDVIDAPDAQTMMAFSIWYKKEGFGDCTTMPVFQRPEFQEAGKIAGIQTEEAYEVARGWHPPSGEKSRKVYVMMGKHSPDWIDKQLTRTKDAYEQFQNLGIRMLYSNYVQGQYDFVGIIDVPDAQAMLAFSIWYRMNKFGHIIAMPAFSRDQMQAAGNRVGVEGA
jgi:uncharacterized protein with GYD domain